jgi:hemolysin activation/secretion protein
MRTRVSIALSAVLLASTAIAAPDAATIQRDIEKNLEKIAPIQKPILKTAPITAEDTIKTTIKSFSFTGNTIVSTSELEKIVAPYVGKELGFNALQKIVAEVSDYYASKGGLAKVYLPKQDITSGNVTIAIIEGKLNSVIIDNKEAKLSTPTAEKYIYSQNAKNAPIKNAELSRALMNLNDLGGLKATSSLAPGAAEGSSDLIVKLKDSSKYSADFGMDNYGSLSTGKIEYNAGINVNNVSHSDLYDALNIRTMATQGIRFARAGYTLPVGYYGDKVGASFSGMTYRLIEGNYNATQGDGFSTTTALNWSHPFVRTKEFNINLNTEGSYKRYGNVVAASLTSVKKVSVLTSTLSMDKADAFMGGGQTTASVGLTYGKLDLKGLSSNYDADQLAAKTNGGYLKYSANVSRQQSLTDTLSLQASLQAQLSNKNLDGGEELSLGGANGVRAYPTSEASGDQGYMANAELRYALTNELTPSVFVDYGRVVTNKRQWEGTNNTNSNLGGYGLGLSYMTSYNLNLKAQASRRLITKYEGQANGNNSDGTRADGNRCWVSGTYFF